MEENYKVKAIISFEDYLGKEINNENEHFERQAYKSEWWTNKERYELLLNKGAIELVEVKKVEAPKTEAIKQEVEPEKKEVKKTAKRETTRRKRRI